MAGSPRLHGILPIDKSQGWTSHDVVARVRRLAGQRQVGHAGTLDPLATGLLLVVLGSATRLSRYLMESRKAYCAEVVFGTRTNTDDAEGIIVASGDCDWSRLRREKIEAAIPRFVGEIMQTPPAYAAVKQDGQRLYALARKGVDVRVEARPVTVHEIRILGWEPPRLRLFVECGSGTYIRSLARDLGDVLGTRGYLHALRRVSSGAFRVAEAATLEVMEEHGVEPYLRRPDLAVISLPAVVVRGPEAFQVIHGAPVALRTCAAGMVRLYDELGRFLAVGEVRGSTLKPCLVFPPQT
jgi:tRNA pseudouridine55 synthase